MKITCPHCEGCGKVALSDHLSDVLTLLWQHEEICAEDLAYYAFCSPNAMRNRLATLAGMGLAKRNIKTGKTWSWIALNSPPAK